MYSVSWVSLVCLCKLVEYCKGSVLLLFICFVVITSKLTTAKQNMLTYLTLLNLHFNTCKFTYYFGLTIILVCRLTQLYLKMTSTLLLCWFLCLCCFFLLGRGVLSYTCFNYMPKRRKFVKIIKNRRKKKKILAGKRHTLFIINALSNIY